MEPLGQTTVADVAGVEARLAALWRDAAEDGVAVTRACTLNLIVACADGEDDPRTAAQLVARLSETEPGRAILVTTRRDSPVTAGELLAHVSAHCHRGAGGAQVCTEQVTIETDATGRALVANTILQLLVEDMPVYTLWRRGELDDDVVLGPLRDLSDRFIVDGAVHVDPAAALRALQRLADASSAAKIADVTWHRTEPWREAVASFFDTPATQPALENVTALDIVAGGPASDGGLTVSAGYVAGWLGSRLGWQRATDTGWRRDDGGEVRLRFRPAPEVPPGELSAVRIESTLDGSPACFCAEREEQRGDVVTMFVDRPGACALPWKLKLPDRDEAALVCGILQRRHGDPLFGPALAAACRMG